MDKRYSRVSWFKDPHTSTAFTLEWSNRLQASHSLLKVASDRFSILARRRQIRRPSITRALTVRWAVHRSILIRSDLRSGQNIYCDAHITAINDHFAEWPAEREAWRRRAGGENQPTASWRTERMNHPLVMMTLWSKLRRRAVYFTLILPCCFKTISERLTVKELSRPCARLIPVLPSRYRFREFLTWISGYYFSFIMYFQVYTTLRVWTLCFLCVWSLFPFMDIHF